MTRTAILLSLALAVACGGTGWAAGPSSPARTSGVNGSVTAGPTCPVERVGHPCPPRPVSAAIRAQTGGGRVVGRTHSDGNGRYAMALPPGRYTLVVQTGSTFPRCPTTPVTVPPNRTVAADISCDTGIR
jgi:hypothetical protein